MIKQEAFYQADPLAKLFVGRLKFTPLKAVLITIGIALLGALSLATITGSLLPNSNQIGFLQSWIGWIWGFVIAPIVTGYYVWIANAIGDLLLKLQKSETIEIQKLDIDNVVPIYKSPFRFYFSVSCAVILGVVYVLTRSDLPGWASANSIILGSTTTTMLLLGYMVGILATTLIANVWALQVIFKKKKLKLNPLHPDRCGGLKALSDYSLKTVYLAAAAGFVIGLSEYRFMTYDILLKYWYIHLSIPLYLIITTISFFAPLSAAHNGMKDAKEELLAHIAQHFRKNYAETYSRLDKSPEKLRGEIDKVQQLHILYDLTDKFPVWPFDVTTLRRFFASATTPFIPLIVGLLSQFVSKLLP